MKKVAFYVNRGKSEAVAKSEELAALCAANSLVVVGADSDPEAIIVLGGDGTMLAAAHEHPGKPLLGLNLGSLGYLASVAEPEFESAVRALAEGRYELSNRTALECNGAIAYNEIVVGCGLACHAALIELSVNGGFAAKFLADGLTFATATGSTAYSLSAGGPILLPDSAAFVVTPMCPHSLASRPFVLPDSSDFTVTLQPRPGVDSVAIIVDGNCIGNLAVGESLKITRSKTVLPLILPAGTDHFKVLNRKLGWAGARI